MSLRLRSVQSLSLMKIILASDISNDLGDWIVWINNFSFWHGKYTFPFWRKINAIYSFVMDARTVGAVWLRFCLRAFRYGRPFLGSYLHVRISSARYGRVMMSPMIFGRDLTGNEISTFPVPGYEKIPPQFNVCRTILSLVDEMTSADDIWSLEKKRF